MSFCPVCQSDESEPFFRSELPFAVKSDGQVLPTSAEVFRCGKCQHLFKDRQTVAEWNNYDDYHLMDNSGEVDKMDFSGKLPIGRSKALVQLLCDQKILGPGTNLFDFGCHRGALLSLLDPGKHAGLDVSIQYKELIERMGYRYYMPEDSPPREEFDVVTLLHVFEHLPDLKHDMNFAMTVLKEGGHILIEVPDAVTQPTDLYVMDHFHHFTAESLSAALSEFPLEESVAPYNFLAGELTAISKKQGVKDSRFVHRQMKEAQLGRALEILVEGEKRLLELKDKKEKKLVYGAGLVGRLIEQNLGDTVVAFVDDNPTLQNKKLHDLSILSPDECQKDLTVVIGVPPSAVEKVYKKCLGLGFKSVVPVFTPELRTSTCSDLKG